jgi:hypothetical protein
MRMKWRAIIPKKTFNVAVILVITAEITFFYRRASNRCLICSFNAPDFSSSGSSNLSL